MTRARPALRYHGGKWILAPWIISFFPEHRIYTEAFGGGASVLLRKPRAYGEIYNDLDREVVNVFRVLRDHGQELARLVACTPFARDEFVESYVVTPDPIEQARRTIIRSFMGFGSAAATGEATGFRANSNRSGTTPAHDWKNYGEALAALIDRFRGTVIENRDAVTVMQAHDGPQTLHYVDPPYVTETRSKKRGSKKSYRFEMTDDAHCELLFELERLQGKVVLSGYDHPIYERLSWTRFERAAMADGARPRTEVLWINPACEAALNAERSQSSMFAGVAA